MEIPLGNKLVAMTKVILTAADISATFINTAYLVYTFKSLIMIYLSTCDFKWSNNT